MLDLPWSGSLGELKMQLVNHGAIMAILLLAGMLALVLGFVLLMSYKRAIARRMQSAVAITNAGDQDNSPRRQPRSQLAYNVELLGQRLDAPHPVRLSADLTVVCGAIYSVAGLIFGVVATFLLFVCSATQFLPLRAATVAWAYAWPVVLTLNLLWSSDRRRQLAVVTFYAGFIGLFCLWSVFTDSRPTTIATITFPAFANPILVWAIFAVPSLFLLLFLNRTVRAVGPVLLIFGSIVFLGWHIAMVCLGTSAGMQAAQWIFAATGVGAGTLLLGVTGAGLAVGAVVGWLVVGRVADAYVARRFSDQMLIVDSIWFLQTLMLCSSLVFEVGYWGAVGLIAFAAYKTTAVVGFRVFSSKLERQSLRLLLLRVFGFSRRSSRLMDLIAARWRYNGYIYLIAAPDLAARTIEPGKLLALLRGRLGRLFVHDRTELERRLVEIDERRDPDGRFRIAELFCAGDVWRAAVKSLMAEAHVVAMDLRSFGPEHQGCVFELQTLLDTVPLERLMCLIDPTTKLEFLKHVLDARWQELRIDSPNARTAAPTMRLREVSGSEGRAVRHLIREAVAIARATPSRGEPLGPEHARSFAARPEPRPMAT
jgi:hypothetical protein